MSIRRRSIQQADGNALVASAAQVRAAAIVVVMVGAVVGCSSGSSATSPDVANQLGSLEKSQEVNGVSNFRSTESKSLSIDGIEYTLLRISPALPNSTGPNSDVTVSVRISNSTNRPMPVASGEVLFLGYGPSTNHAQQALAPETHSGRSMTATNPHQLAPHESATVSDVFATPRTELEQLTIRVQVGNLGAFPSAVFLRAERFVVN